MTADVFDDLEKWRISSLFHSGAYCTWRWDDLFSKRRVRSGTLGNPACVVEALHHDGNAWLPPRWDDEKAGASLFASAGWWDEPYKSHNHPDFRL